MKYMNLVLALILVCGVAWTAPAENDGVQVQEYVWDFAVDGGDVGEIFLSSKSSYSPLPVGAIVKQVTAKVVTAVVSSGSGTLVWGNDDDPDGYSGSAIGSASLTDNALFNGWDNGAVLLWDDSNDHAIPLNVADTDDGEFSVSIASSAFSAGKAIFLVEYYYPSLK